MATGLSFQLLNVYCFDKLCLDFALIGDTKLLPTLANQIIFVLQTFKVCSKIPFKVLPLVFEVLSPEDKLPEGDDEAKTIK